MIIVGIDYSINGPAVCVHEGDEWSIDNCTIHFMSTVKKHCVEFFNGQVKGTYLSTKTEKDMYPQKRYLVRARWVYDILGRLRYLPLFTYHAIEGYSLNSKGKIDSIIENASTLKTYLYLGDSTELTMYPPTTIKKFASGKGNADKEKMILQFIKETGWDIHDIMTPDVKFGSGPVEDIVDSYFVAKMKFEEVKNEANF